MALVIAEELRCGPLTVRQGQTTFGMAHTGQVVWDASRSLARALLALPAGALAGRRALELGAGCTGLPGLAAAARGAHVTLTDLPAELEQLRGNVERNAAVVAEGGGAAEVAGLDWSSAPAADGAPVAADAVDLVLAADVLYEGTLDAFLGALHAVARGPEVEVLLVNTSRKAVFLCERRLRRSGEWAFEPAEDLAGSETDGGEVRWRLRRSG